jgi:Na+/phosphate symporter
VEKEFTKLSLREQLKTLCSLVDIVRHMLGAGRHAFNRHSQKELETISELKDTFTLDIDPFFEQVEAGLERASEAEKADLLKIQRVLTQLELMAHNIFGLIEPIRRKGNQGTILSDRDFFQVNDLFAKQTGFMRALVDIFQQNDPALKAYVLNESRQVRDTCFQDESAHQTGMMDSPGQPGAWSIYINILDSFRDSLEHLILVVKSLD